MGGVDDAVRAMTKSYHHRDELTGEIVAQYPLQFSPKGFAFLSPEGKPMTATFRTQREAILALEEKLHPGRRREALDDRAAYGKLKERLARLEDKLKA